ncbi:hypothetical protein SNE26_07135 [Mucilaginibacter sp. cycad4]|uniref:hypothetical protein n=1 Tax=Mucilaginibacter sp. cycad4 TaxID=3342096 RepID=UPI002AAACB20|nr:hypothetical protein [Mucilaginibacter gossypii]WPV01545.1 hypothetical protein SNE26_07135 [Mucilaginibacter gossypii]
MKQNIQRFFFPYLGMDNSLFKAFYQYPTIKYLTESSWNNKPAYIDPTAFSQTIVYLLQGSQASGTANAADRIKNVLFTTKLTNGPAGNSIKIQKETCEHMAQLWNDASGDINQFKLNLEGWYNQTMDRVSGWYTKQTKLILFFIGLFIANAFHVDTIAIYKLLAKNSTARNDLVQLAISRGTKENTQTATMDDETLKAASTTVRADIAQASQILSINNPENDSCLVCRIFQKQQSELITAENDLKKKKDSTSNGFKRIKQQQGQLNLMIRNYSPACKNATHFKYPGKLSPGYLLTALAISLGSTFWFDLLNRLVQLRGTGAKPDDSSKNTGGLTNPPIKPVG